MIKISVNFIFLIKKIAEKITIILEYLSGDFAYKKYLEHHLKNHSKLKPLDRKNFLRNRLKNKSLQRCC